MDFIQHEGDFCPVPPEAWVTYRTTCRNGIKSHAHRATQAKNVNWKEYKGSRKNTTIGRIVEYKVVKKPTPSVYTRMYSDNERSALDSIKDRQDTR